MKTATVLSTLVVLFVFISASEAARQPRSQPWLAVLSFTCGRSANDSCIGVVLDNHWVLTTATCFMRCRGDLPQQLSVSVNIPPGAQRRVVSAIHSGKRVNGSLVWQHPKYDSGTFVNNLALVKLDCHDYALEKINLASNCSTHGQTSSDGYIHIRNRAIRFKNAKEEVECFSKLGTGTWYYLASTLQMVATTLSNSNCMEMSICEHTKQIESFMEENKINCTNEVPLISSNIIVPNISDEINDTVITPSIIPKPETDTTTSKLISATPVAASKISIQQIATSAVKVPAMLTSSQIDSLSMIPTPVAAVSVSTKFLVPTETPTSTQVSTSTEIPTSTKAPTSSAFSTEISAEIPETPTSTNILEISTSTKAPISTLISTKTSSVSAELPQTTTSMQVSSSTEIPISPTSSIILTETVSTPTKAPVSTETTSVKATSTMISELSSTSSSTSAQVSTSAEIQSITKSSSPPMIPTPTSTEISTQISPSSPAVAETSSSQVILSTQLPTATPTESPNSGCQLSLENGKAISATILPRFLLITYTCNPGYRFRTAIGTDPLTLGCTDGKMAIRPPACELIACPTIEPLENGQVVVSGSGLGDTAIYSCNKGYILSGGFTVRVCKATHEWSGAAGVCKPACPIPESLVCNDGMRILPSSFRFHTIGESASYAERDSYVLIGENPVCQPNSTWSAPPTCFRRCNEKQVIPNAQVHIHRNASSYTRTVVCDEGYEAVGVSDQRCARTGSWTPYFQECRRTCNPITLDDGNVMMLKSQSFLIALMQCDEGFHLEPAVSAIICGTNGQWMSSIPKCVADK